MKRVFLVFLLLSVSAYAAELGYELFEYPAGSIIGQSGGMGWGNDSNGWIFPVGVTCTQGTAEVDANSLTFSSYPTSGGALKLTEDNNQVPPGTRYVGIRRLVGFQTPVGADLWVSFLAKSNGVLTDFTSRIAEIRHGATAGATKLRMRPKDNASQGVYIAYDSASTPNSIASTQNGNVYFYICRFEDVETATGGPATMWVLNEAGYNTAMTDGILTENDLNAYYYLKATDEHSNQNLNAGDGTFINLTDSSTTDNFAYYFDELRYGTSLGNVVPNPYIASNPSPDWGQINVTPPSITLSWKPGLGVITNGHQVYFGTDRTAVETATTSDTNGIYRGSQDANTYNIGTLALGTSYFWRIDEVTSTGTKKGYVWDFLTFTDLGVDNFESYTDTASLQNSWQDRLVNNSGATVDLSTTVYHQGVKSMRYLYENQYGDSIATKNYATSQNWYFGGKFVVMDVWFRGTAANTTDGTMFVKIEDSNGATATVNYPTSADLAVETWKVWHIDMSSFTDVNLQSVKKFTIGFTGGSGSGFVYFDDIAIYQCRPGALAGDINGDCLVNFKDFAAVAEEWGQTKPY